METVKKETLFKAYENEASDSTKGSMNVEDYKKQIDISDAIFEINSLVSNNKRIILDTIKAELESLNTEINLDKYVSNIGTSKIGMNLYFETLYEYPELFYPDLTVSCVYYTDSSGSIIKFSLKVTYIYDSVVIDVMKRYLSSKVKEIKDNYLNSNLTQLEKEYIIHDYLLENCTYDTSRNIPTSSHTSYAVLLSGKAVCDGYSKAAKLLFNECGIDAGIVVSDSMNHAWNYIKMNGYYYFIDITWDDPVPETYISKYSYFNRNTDEMISGNHTWITSDYPVSTSSVFSFLRSYNSLTRSNDKLYYIDNNNLYAMTLDGKNKTLVKSAFPWDSSLGLIGYTNNLYYVRSLYDATEKKTYSVIEKYNLALKNTEICFRTLGQIKKIYKKNVTIAIQYTKSADTTTISTTSISIKIEGDTNRDGIVNSTDMNNLQSSYNKMVGQAGYVDAWDFNNDGIIDIYDITKTSSRL
ncbi:MAG: hypothetical protein E7213_10815 [Clostridium sp.]|nr:hypothetical protein [Clostridium sp.]